MSGKVLVAHMLKDMNANSTGLSRKLFNVCIFGGAAALCAYAGYRAWAYYCQEEEDEWFLARETLDSDDDDDDDDDEYVDASETLEL